MGAGTVAGLDAGHMPHQHYSWADGVVRVACTSPCTYRVDFGLASRHRHAPRVLISRRLSCLFVQRNGAPPQEADIHDAEHKLQDEEDASEGNGGYTFDTPEHKEQLKAQRQQLWQCGWLKKGTIQQASPWTQARVRCCPFSCWFLACTCVARHSSWAGCSLPAVCRAEACGRQHVQRRWDKQLGVHAWGHHF
eukprot:664492-Pelagomonas_calceolata.AAC.1